MNKKQIAMNFDLKSVVRFFAAIDPLAIIGATLLLTGLAFLFV